jgi:hypothetical protein
VIFLRVMRAGIGGTAPGLLTQAADCDLLAISGVLAPTIGLVADGLCFWDNPKPHTDTNTMNRREHGHSLSWTSPSGRFFLGSYSLRYTACKPEAYSGARKGVVESHSVVLDGTAHRGVEARPVANPYP